MRLFLLLAMLPVFGWSQIDTADICKEVLTKLVESRGGLTNDIPSIRISSRIKNIAAYSPLTNEIILEQRALELCLDLSTPYNLSALAFVIAHEFTHYLQHYEWKTLGDSVAFFIKKGEMSKHRRVEREADLYGAFLCYLAGYDHIFAPPAIIERLYHAYEFDEDNSNYPSTEERKSVILEVSDQASSLILLFQFANYFSQLESYEWSQAIYQYLATYVDHKEIYANAGANQLKAYLASYSELYYPIYYKKSLKLRAAPIYHPDSLISYAINNFSKAIIKDPKDLDLYYNLIISYLASDKVKSARIILKELRELQLSEPLSEKLHLLDILASLQDGTIKDGEEALQALLVKTQQQDLIDVCRRNLNVLRNIEDNSDAAIPAISFFPDLITQDSELYTINKLDNDFPIVAELSFSDSATLISISQGDTTSKMVISKVKLHSKGEQISVHNYLESVDKYGNQIHIYFQDH